MARARNIKPGFFANENLAECDPLARILFAGLWCLADREGRLEDRPKRIRAELLPYDACDADDLLGQLQEHGFVLRYELGGQRYIQVLNFCKHQNPHVKEAKSTIPAPAGNESAPDEHSTGPVQVPDEHQKSPADSLIPDSLIPESLQEHVAADAPTASQAQAQADDAGEPVQPKAQRAKRLPADWTLPAEWLAWALADRPEFPEAAMVREGEKFADHWHAASKNAAKLDWLATWRNWVRNARLPQNVRAFPQPQQSRFTNLPPVNAEELRAKAAENAKLGVRRANF